MKVENLTVLLIVICVVLAVETAAVIIILLKIHSRLLTLKNTQAAVQNVQDGNMQSGSAGLPKNSTSLQYDGLVICRSCYKAIPSNSKTCPCCQAVVSRR